MTPAGWTRATVGDVCAVIAGQSPPGSSYNVRGEGMPFFQGKAEFGDLRPTVRNWTTDGRKFAERDDILLSVRAPVGPTNLAPSECVIGRGLAAIRPLADIDPRYILYAFRASAHDLVSGATGSTFGAVTGGQVRAHPLPLAPLAEQRRIVAAIEEQFSRLDACEESFIRAIQLLAVLRESVIESALAGEWPTVRVGDVGDGSRNALAIGPFGSNLKVSDYRDSGVPLIFVRNIRMHNFDGPNPRFVSAEKAAELQAHTVRPGDVLVTKMGEPPGDTAVYPFDKPSAILTADCIKITPGVDFDAAFLAFAIAAAPAREQVLSVTKGVAQKKVSLARFKTISLPAPPLDRQQRIVAELEQQLSLIDALRAAVESAQRRSSVLRRAILERAFRGELVPQDPADEPASALLERIRAERAAALPARRARADRASR